MTVAVLIGNPSPGGRTTTVGQTVGAAVADARGGDAVVTIELASVASRLFDWGNTDVAALLGQVAAADIVVVACPTYKATFTGLLKAFLDNFGNDGLAGCMAVPVMVGASLHHALAPEVHLRPLLVELGASVPSRGLYVLDSTMDSLDQIVAEWAETAGPLLAR